MVFGDTDRYIASLAAVAWDDDVVGEERVPLKCILGNTNIGEIL